MRLIAAWPQTSATRPAASVLPERIPARQGDAEPGPGEHGVGEDHDRRCRRARAPRRRWRGSCPCAPRGGSGSSARPARAPRRRGRPSPGRSCACTIWKPAPCASSHGLRKLSRRSRRYGSNQIATAPSAIVIPAAEPSTRPGTPLTSSSAEAVTKSEIVVPRSGSTRISGAEDARARSPNGFTSSDSVCGGFRRDRYAAPQIANASFASSDGWNVNGPTPSHRRAPFTGSATHEHGDAEHEGRDEERRRERAELAEVEPRGEDQQRRARAARRSPAASGTTLGSSPPSAAAADVAL